MNIKDESPRMRRERLRVRQARAAAGAAYDPVVARAFWAKLAALPDLPDEQRAAWVAMAAEA